MHVWPRLSDRNRRDWHGAAFYSTAQKLFLLFLFSFCPVEEKMLLDCVALFDGGALPCRAHVSLYDLIEFNDAGATSAAVGNKTRKKWPPFDERREVCTPFLVREFAVSKRSLWLRFGPHRVCLPRRKEESHESNGSTGTWPQSQQLNQQQVSREKKENIRVAAN